MKRHLTPLNPTFAACATPELIIMLEQACVFEAAGLEAELNARLERTGQRWRFDRQGRIVLFYPTKSRPHQQPCDIGLFDTHGGRQTDLADLLARF